MTHILAPPRANFASFFVDYLHTGTSPPFAVQTLVAALKCKSAHVSANPRANFIFFSFPSKPNCKPRNLANKHGDSPPVASADLHRERTGEHFALLRRTRSEWRKER